MVGVYRGVVMRNYNYLNWWCLVNRFSIYFRDIDFDGDWDRMVYDLGGVLGRNILF